MKNLPDIIAGSGPTEGGLLWNVIRNGWQHYDRIKESNTIKEKYHQIIPHNYFFAIGNAEERIKGADTEDASEVEISEDDIDLVASQTGKSKEEAENALKEANGDLAEAIMRLS